MDPGDTLAEFVGTRDIPIFGFASAGGFASALPVGATIALMCC